MAGFTDAMVRSAKAEPGKRLELTDDKCAGLNLRVTDKGTKTWAFVYRPVGGRKTKTGRVTLGRYPTMSLSDARTAADKLRGVVVAGEVPKRAVATPVGVLFGELADRYIDEYAKPRKKSWQNDVSFLKRPRAAWKRKAARDVTDDDVAGLLTKIAANMPVAANRTQSVLHKMFAWAKEPGRKLVTVNPCAGLSRQARETPKDRVLSDAEIKVLWRGLSERGCPVAETFALALKVILATMARPGMVAAALRSELIGLVGRERAEWHLPADRMKSGKPFIVPLSKLAVGLFKSAIKVPDQLVVFPSKWSVRAEIARHSISQSLIEVIAHLKMKPFTPHDLRRTAATIARRAGAPRDSVEALLAHTRQDVTDIYDKYDMLKEKREAANILGREISRLIR